MCCHQSQWRSREELDYAQTAIVVGGAAAAAVAATVHRPPCRSEVLAFLLQPPSQRQQFLSERGFVSKTFLLSGTYQTARPRCAGSDVSGAKFQFANVSILGSIDLSMQTQKRGGGAVHC